MREWIMDTVGFLTNHHHHLRVLQAAHALLVRVEVNIADAMNSFLFSFLFLSLGLVSALTNVSESASQYKAAAAKSNLSQWDYLNATLGGRLEKGIPVSTPCFPIVDGTNVTVNDTVCAAVQKGYGDPLFRAPIFGAYMLVSAVSITEIQTII